MKQPPSYQSPDSHDMNRQTNRFLFIFLLLPMLVGLVYFMTPEPADSVESSQTSALPSIVDNYFSDFVETDVFPLRQLISFLGEEGQTSTIIPFENSTHFYYRIHQSNAGDSFQIVAQLDNQQHLEMVLSAYRDAIKDHYDLVQQISVEPFEALYMDVTESIRLNLIDFKLEDYKFYLRFVFQLNQ